MGKKVKFDDKVLFELETINGEEFLKKHDKDASKKVGKPVYVMKPLNEILNSEKPIIYLR